MLIWSREIKKNKNEIKGFTDENKIWEAQVLGAQQNHFFFFFSLDIKLFFISQTLLL